MKLRKELLAAMCPRPRSGASKQGIWDGYVAALSSEEAAKLFQEFDVTTNRRMAHFLANGAHESGGLTILWESGAYSAERIMEIFGVGKHSAAVTWPEAKRLAGNGPALFDRVYGVGNPRKAAELGNDKPGDGWRYRGLSWMQITGKDDHCRYATAVGCSVEDLEKPINGIHAALLEWKAKGCNKWADTDDTVKVRKLINGGRNGLAEVREYVAKAKVLLEQQAPERDGTLPPDNILRLGSEGPLVYWLQQQLMVHGYYPGNLDSKFGKSTEKQLVAWQHQHGFKVTGEFDPDDKEQRDTLNITPTKSDDAAPARDVTAKDLAERGSRTIGLAQRIKSTVKWFWGLLTGVATGEAAGLEPVNRLVSAGEQAQSTIGRAAKLAGVLPPAWILVGLGLLALTAVLYLIAHAFQTYRVDDAASGKNMGK